MRKEEGREKPAPSRTSFIGEKMKIAKKHFLNYSILIPYLMLSIIGLIIVYSTTSAYQIQKGRVSLWSRPQPGSLLVG